MSTSDGSQGQWVQVSMCCENVEGWVVVVPGVSGARGGEEMGTGRRVSTQEGRAPRLTRPARGKSGMCRFGT